MKTLKFNERLLNNSRSNENFSRALERLRNGKPETPRSWVYENEDPAKVLKKWTDILKTLDGDLKEISDWDLSKQDKFGPQGAVASFEVRQETLQEYWAHLESSPIFQSIDWQKAKAAVARQLGFNKSGVPRPVEKVIERGLSEDKYNTSSGDPLFLKRKNPIAIEQAKEAVSNGTWNLYYPTLGSRASMGKVNEEARWIFMFPMCVNLYEQTFQQPLQDYIRSKKVMFFTPWEGYDYVQDQLTSMADSDSLFFGCDYSKMDQHFNFYHAKECYDVIKLYFHPKYWDDLYESIHYTFYCSVIAPDYLIEGPHAMPSGSGWTNFLETVFNYILIEYFKIHYGFKFNGQMGIGDDQLWFISYRGNVDKLIRLVVSVFKSVGLDANDEKQEVSYDVASFLQRRSWLFYAPGNLKLAAVYATVRALTSEIFPEFYHNDKEWTKSTFALRCLMIMENCSNHPLFEEFCVFIAKGNDNIREFVLSDDAFIIETRRRSKKIANFLPTYNQAKIDEDPTKFKSLAVLRAHFGKKD